MAGALGDLLIKPYRRGDGRYRQGRDDRNRSGDRR